MDNLSVHKSPGVRAAIEAVGAQLMYLPPYSPDFNPIENQTPGERLSGFFVSTPSMARFTGGRPLSA